MQVFTQSFAKHPWLPLLIVFVFCAGVSNPACWAGSEQQEIGMEAASELELSEDDAVITGFTAERTANNFPSLSPVFSEKMPPFTGSDAYPGITLHGPPATGLPV